MARTVDIANTAVRRDAFIDAAEQLFRSRGYEHTSVQDILDALGVSRGAFYHYFGSKSELLEAVVDRMVTQIAQVVEPIVDDPGIPAPDKLRRLFEAASSWKLARADLMHAVLEAWVSDENALMREKYRRHVTRALTPLLARIADQGIRDGTITTLSAEGTARTIIHLLLGFQEEAVLLLVAARSGLVTFEEVWRTLSGYPAVIEHAAGLPPGTFPFIDKETLRPWFE